MKEEGVFEDTAGRHNKRNERGLSRDLVFLGW